ncbi:hypothetical protein [Actinomadura gamaensis]|uniref:Uncharacterized protein n=1 Tax=Actinomadura gamaensis TaxID=1763541 RepID=A0ABV9U2T1_9ACTN
MTERSRRAPDPSEPSRQDEVPARSADLSALYRTDALIEALSARALPLTRRSPSDPALGLLGALISEVDEGLPELSRARPRLDRAVEVVMRHGTDANHSADADADALPDGTGPARRDADADAPEQQGSGPSRRGPRTIVALGVAGAVLASTGVAAAGGGLVETPAVRPATKAAGKPGPSRQVKPGGDETTSGTSHPSARRAPVTTPAPAHDGKRGAGKRDASGASGTGSEKRRVPTPDEEQQLKKRLQDLLDNLPQPRPSAHHDPVEDTRRRLDDIRRRAEHRLDQYRDDHPPR